MIYRFICTFNKTYIWYYIMYVIILNSIRFCFFIWTLILFDKNIYYGDGGGGDGGGGDDGNGNLHNNTGANTGANTDANNLNFFHYGPIQYNIIFYLINLGIDIWFVKLLYRYYTLIQNISVFQIIYLKQNALKIPIQKKHVILW